MTDPALTVEIPLRLLRRYATTRKDIDRFVLVGEWLLREIPSSNLRWVQKICVRMDVAANLDADQLEHEEYGSLDRRDKAIAYRDAVLKGTAI